MKTSIVILSIIIIGSWTYFLSKEHDQDLPVVPDRSKLYDSAKKEIAKNKIEYAKQDTIIYTVRIDLRNRFIAIDSLSYDSAYLLWTDEARQYEPSIN